MDYRRTKSESTLPDGNRGELLSIAYDPVSLRPTKISRDGFVSMKWENAHLKSEISVISKIKIVASLLKSTRERLVTIFSLSQRSKSHLELGFEIYAVGSYFELDWWTI